VPVTQEVGDIRLNILLGNLLKGLRNELMKLPIMKKVGLHGLRAKTPQLEFGLELLEDSNHPKLKG